MCVDEHAFVHLFAAFVSGEFSIKKKAGGLGGAQPPPICKLFSSFAIDCVFFALNPLKAFVCVGEHAFVHLFAAFVSGEFTIKKSGGVGGGGVCAPPICKLFHPSRLIVFSSR